MAETMKAAVLTARRTIEIQERPIPEPNPGEVRLKIAAVGVCGSDVHYYKDGRIGHQVVQFPTLLGHEPSGVVDAIGEGVSLTAGTRVAVEPAAPCMKCEFCLNGKPHICPDVKFLGTPPVDGIFEQYHIMPEHCCIPIPDSMSLVEAALLEPLGVGLHAVNLANPQMGETAAIFGSGPIGLCTLLGLKLTGVKQIFMTDKIPQRLRLAESLGADEIQISNGNNIPDWIMDMTSGRGVDITFEAAGNQDSMNDAYLCARRGGRTMMIGIPPTDECSMPMHKCRQSELLVQHVRRSNGEVSRCLSLIASGRMDIKRLATHFFVLEDITDAFNMVREYRDGVIRAMIIPNGKLE